MWLYIIALQNRTRHCTQSTSIDLPGNTLTQESLWCKSVIVVSQCFSAVQNCVKYFCLPPPLKFSSPPLAPPPPPPVLQVWCRRCLHAVGPFYSDAFRHFYVAWLAQIFTTCGSKRAISSPTISPNLSRNACSFFSFELLKSFAGY